MIHIKRLHLGSRPQLPSLGATSKKPPPRIEQAAVAPLSVEDADTLYDYQRRERKPGKLEAKWPAMLGAFCHKPSPHRFGQHLFFAMGVVPTRTASEALFQVLLSARVIDSSRHIGHLSHLDRALSHTQLTPEQRSRVASIVHAFAEQSSHLHKLELRLSELSHDIGEREAHRRRHNLPFGLDRTLVELIVTKARLKAQLRARPSDLQPPPAYEADASPPAFGTW